MRAVLCRAHCEWDQLSIEDCHLADPGDWEVKIEVHHASVSFAMGLQVAGTYQRAYPLPFTPGTEVAGVVLQVGKAVSHLRPGDRVLAICDWGGLAEQVLVHSATVYALPPQLAFIPAIHLPIAYSTAYGALFWRGQLQAGETVVVLGAAGAVGIAAIELARQAGARVIAVASSAEKRRFAIEHGADVALASEDGTADQSGLRAAILEASQGKGIDLLYDPVGSPLFDTVLRTLKPFGRALIVGFAGGKVPQIPANLLLVKNISVVGHNMGLYYGWTPTNERVLHEPKMRAMMNDLFAMTLAGQLKPHVYHQFAFEQFREAMAVIRRRENQGKVVINIRKSL